MRQKDTIVFCQLKPIKLTACIVLPCYFTKITSHFSASIHPTKWNGPSQFSLNFLCPISYKRSYKSERSAWYGQTWPQTMESNRRRILRNVNGCCRFCRNRQPFCPLLGIGIAISHCLSLSLTIANYCNLTVII